MVNNLVVYTGTPPNLTKWNDLKGDTQMMPVHITLNAAQDREVLHDHFGKRLAGTRSASLAAAGLDPGKPHGTSPISRCSTSATASSIQPAIKPSYLAQSPITPPTAPIVLNLKRNGSPT